MSEHPKPCRWAGHDQPRMLRSHVRDCEAAGCEGCAPCTQPHCSICGIRHVVALTCPACVGVVRDDLALIEALAEKMLPEAVCRGVNSEAAMLAGPAADVEAWRNRWMSARSGRIPADWLEDCRDELHPLYVLGTWDMLITEHYDHDTRTGQVTVESAVQYLGANLTDLAQDPGFAFEELAREVRSCRGHMEDVLHDGEREDRGAPCPMCGAGALVKQFGTCTCRQLGMDHCDKACGCNGKALSIECDTADRWVCPRKNCDARYTEHDYRIKVEAVYVLHADRLTASQIAETYRVPEGTVRQWALRDKVRKHGPDAQGRTLYDVADVLNARDAIPA